MQPNAILALATGSHCGEIVFNTDMAGCQKILIAPTSLSEASPNPHDTENLFVGFVVVMRESWVLLLSPSTMRLSSMTSLAIIYFAL